MKKLLAFLILLCFATPVFAAIATAPVFFTVPQRESYQFTHSIAINTYETVYTAATDGSKITAILLSTNDPTAHIVTCSIVNGGVNYPLFSLTTGTGTPGYATGTAALNVMNNTTYTTYFPVDGDGNPYFYMVNGDTLQCQQGGTIVTSSDYLNITAIGADAT